VDGEYAVYPFVPLLPIQFTETAIVHLSWAGIDCPPWKSMTFTTLPSGLRSGFSDALHPAHPSRCVACSSRDHRRGQLGSGRAAGADEHDPPRYDQNRRGQRGEALRAQPACCLRAR
jgi:hypothetical protein